VLLVGITILFATPEKKCAKMNDLEQTFYSNQLYFQIIFLMPRTA